MWAPLLALLAVLAIGTLGYALIEGWSVADALYMAVTTVATVGFGEVHPLSGLGRAFTILLILLGVGALYYTFGALMGFVFEGQLSRRWERGRMQRRIDQQREHYILCGYGRVGRSIARVLERESVPFVVIDRDPDAIERATRDGVLALAGNGSDDDVLRQAGIERARGLITAVAADADNIFVTLSARALRPDLTIVARANYDDTAAKLLRAGATRAVSPYGIAGRQMAMLAVRPSAVDIVETLLHGSGGHLLVEDLEVASGSSLAGLSVAEVRSRFADGATLLALRRDGRMLAPPPVELPIQPGDTIAMAGTEEQLREVERACGRRAAEAPEPG